MYYFPGTPHTLLTGSCSFSHGTASSTMHRGYCPGSHMCEVEEGQSAAPPLFWNSHKLSESVRPHRPTRKRIVSRTIPRSVFISYVHFVARARSYHGAFPCVGIETEPDHWDVAPVPRRPYQEEFESFAMVILWLPDSRQGEPGISFRACEERYRRSRLKLEDSGINSDAGTTSI
jgi:hypothetical protein